jgi:hypothetical protein
VPVTHIRQVKRRRKTLEKQAEAKENMRKKNQKKMLT